jgi:phosphopentomutase
MSKRWSVSPTALARRVVVVVLDGVGVGELPDAGSYGDSGSDTLGNLARAVGGLSLPHLAAMGLGLIHAIDGVPALGPLGAAGIMGELSPGKDTLTGHWELAGLVTGRPVPTYPLGFPPGMLTLFETAIGGPVLGNKVASGTEIIKELGEEHVRTGYPIVYTSADSVLQIAAHEDVIPPAKLYWMCEMARRLYSDAPYLVGRIIARPFSGVAGSFRRTAGRHDYSLPPPGPTLLEDVSAAGLATIGVGKIWDIFAGRGLTDHRPAASNAEVLGATVTAVRDLRQGLVLANLVDFDMIYGHRNDPLGFARALEAFDRELPRLRQAVLDHRDGGFLVISADHGCDPTTASTDHSREYVPVLVEGVAAEAEGDPPAGETGPVSLGPRMLGAGVDLGRRESFADLAATVAELLGVTAYRGRGQSFASAFRGEVPSAGAHR